MFGDAGLSDIEIRITADLARLRQDMAAANGLVDRGLQSMRSAADSLKGAFSGLLGALSVAAFGSWVKSAIDAADALDEMSQRVGVGADELSRLQVAYQMAGLQSDTMQSSLAKLSKQMAEGGGAFDTLGVKTRNADGSLRGATAVLGDLADEFQGIKDGSAKTAIAMELFGKSGADMVPLLNGGSEGLREMAKLAEDLGVALDEQTAKNAGEFNDTLDALGLAAKGAGTQLASAMLPTLNSLAGALLDSAKGGSVLDGVAGALSGTLKALYAVGAGVSEVFKTVGTMLGVTVAQLMSGFRGVGDILKSLFTGDFKGAQEAFARSQREFASIQSEALADNQARWAATGERIQKVWDETNSASAKAAADFIRTQRELQLKTKQQEEADRQAAAEAKKLREERERLAKAGQQYLNSLSDQGAALRLQLATGRELSAQDKALIELERDLREGKMTLTTAEQARARAQIASNQSLRDGVALAQSLAKAEQDLNKFTAQSLADRQKDTQALQEQVAKEREHLASIGATREQLLALEQARLDDAIAAKEQQIAALNAVGYYPAERAEIEKQIAALRELRDLKGQSATRTVAVEAAQEAQKAWEQTTQQIGQGLTDSLFRAFEAGKGFFDTLWKGIVNTFKTTALKLVTQGQDGKGGIVGMLMGALGLGGAGGAVAAPAGQPGLLGSISSMGSLFSGASKLPGALGFLTAGAGGSIAAGSALGFGNTFALGSQLATSGGTLAGFSTAGQLAGAGQFGAASGMALGTIAPWALGIGAGAMGGRLLSNGFALSGSGNSLSNIGTIAGAFFGGPIGAAIGGLLGGAINRAFGRKAPEVQGRELAGSFAGGDFTGSVETQMLAKGGWFRSDKRWAESAAVSDELGSELDRTAADLLAQAKRYGEALGLPVQSLADVQAKFRIQLGDDEAKNKEALAKALGDYNDALLGTFSTQLAPVQREGETAAQAMERLSGSLLGANAALQGLNVILFNASVAGADAASQLVELFGGLEQLGTATADYYGRYYSEAERAAAVTQQVTAALADAGLAMPATKEAFRALVEAQDLTTASGREAFATLMGVAGAFDELTQVRDAGLQTAIEAERELAAVRAENAQALQSAIDGILPRVLSHAQLEAQRYARASDQLAGLGLNFDASTLKGASAQAIVDFAQAFVLAADNSDQAKTALIGIVGSLLDLKDAATEAANTSAITAVEGQLNALRTTFGDLSVLGSVETVSQAFVRNRTELQRLEEGLSNLLGSTVQTVQQQLAELLQTQKALQAYRGGTLAGAIEDARLRSLSPESRVASLRSTESDLFAQLQTAADPVAVAQRLQAVVIARIKEEAGLRTRDAQAASDLAQQARDTQIATLREQISGAERLRNLAKDLQQFTGSLRFSDLSPLGFEQQLGAARSLFDRTLADAQAGDTQAQGQLSTNARAYLEEARSFYASSSQYAAIFGQVTSALDSMGASADPQLAVLQQQLASLEALQVAQVAEQNTAGEELIALQRIDTALAARSNTLDAAIERQTTAAREQIEALREIVTEQKAQLAQAAEATKRLETQLQELNDTTGRQLAMLNLQSERPPERTV